MYRFRVFLVLFFLVTALCFMSCSSVNDDTIATDIKAKMFSEPLLKSATVNVTSKNGIVTITGIVPGDAARLAAERIASQTKGVKQVIDSTTVAPPQPLAAENPPSPEPTPPPAPAAAASARSSSAAARPR